MTAATRPWTGMVIAAVLLVTGCDSGPRELRIGVLVAQTGSSGARGKDLLNGATLAAEEINAADYKIGGNRLAVKIEASDDRGEVPLSKQQAQTFVDSGVNAIIGPVNTPQAAAVIPVVAAKGIPQMITATGASLVGLGSGNVLRLLASDDKQGRAMASFANEISVTKRIATITEKSDYGRGLALTFGDALRAKSLAPVLAVELDDGALPADLIARLKDAKVDVIALFAREGQLNALLDGMEAAAMTDVTVLGTNVVRNKSVAQRPVRIKALYATATAIDASEFPEGKAFLERFHHRFGTDPVWGAQISYDAVYALADAARQGRSVDPAQLVATLKRIEPITQVNQQMRFASSGEQVYPNIAVYKAEREAWHLQMMSATW
ncbi:MAG: branched-chain amino acid ABC transporter substrate-binding protein [Vitreoscilla sp.]